MKELYEIREIPIDQIVIPSVRVSAHMDEEEMKVLEESIERFGLFAEPIVIEKDGRYELVAGKNRLEVLKKKGAKTVKCRVFKGSESDAVLVHLAENFARGRISALELDAYIRKIRAERGMSLEEISKFTGISVSKLRAAERIAKLEDEIRSALLTGQITDSHALLLAQIKDKEQRMDVFEKIITYGLTVDQARKYWWHGWLKKCDICGKEGQELQVIFRDTPQEKWVCPECLEKHYPNIDKLLKAAKERFMKMIESGEIPTDFSKMKFKCFLCDGVKEAYQQRILTICKECHAKLLRILDNMYTQLGKEIKDMDMEELDKLVFRKI
ncbi:hypothetical protein DRO54_06685 [Candidatus Bathyarchaeota archaeon]|nr:MAG: hypothetical protein DRO54_06685 [Candidatus Bathyarchaeota archaeon]